MKRENPIVLVFTLVNRDCIVSKILNENGIKHFRILGIRPVGGAFSHLVEVTERGSRLRIFDSEGCELCRIISSEGVFLLSAKSRGNVMRCEVIIRDRKSMRRLSSRLKSFPGFRILALKVGRSVLTPRQEEVLMTALRMGYFDNPRKLKMRELAELLGVSPATLTELLRRALRNLIIERYSELLRERSAE